MSTSGAKSIYSTTSRVCGPASQKSHSTPSTRFPRADKKHCAHLMIERRQLETVEAAAALRRHPFWPHGDSAPASFLDAVLLDYIICFGQVRRDAVAQAWRRVIRKEQSMLIALAAARTGSGHLVVELVMPFVAGRRLGDAPFYAY